jgi:hypothetical protein
VHAFDLRSLSPFFAVALQKRRHWPPANDAGVKLQRVVNPQV